MNERPGFLAKLAEEDRAVETPLRVERALRARVAAVRKPVWWVLAWPVAAAAMFAVLCDDTGNFGPHPTFLVSAPSCTVVTKEQASGQSSAHVVFKSGISAFYWGQSPFEDAKAALH